MKKPIDHQARTGHHYEPKGPMSDESRAALSDSIKEFNRKTGKFSAVANKQVKMTRRSKP